ncbi:MAG: protein translocase subunit SecD [Candidatus Bipolaricaulota bacterium]|nr:protein translocase subunit SecD [Candidatus Bipolaricaulota bacterium]MBS3791657.1 protein translocase subunit SecD [Candidatus Bipolaricaulota bacterium]
MNLSNLGENTLLKTGIILLVFGLAVFFLYPFYPIDDVVNLGLDLKGGTRIVLEAEGVEDMNAEERDRTIERIVTILTNRVNQYGLTEPTIRPLGDRRVEVELPGTTDPEVARRLIGRTALLEFQKVVDQGSPGSSLSPNDLSQEVVYGRKQDNGERVPYLVQKTPLMTGKVLKDAQVRTSQSAENPIFVALQFNSEGAQEFSDVITSLEPNQDRIAIVLDNVVQSAPVISQGIWDNAQNSNSIDRATIEGDFSADEAKRLAVVLRAGALPVEVNEIQKKTVGPSLGQDAIRAGVTTILVGFLLVLLFMPLRYRWLGVIADIVLIFNMLIMFAALSVFGATLTLPGIAGVILTIGISVDANIIIFERIKEELASGKSGVPSVRDGFKKSLSTVVDANLTTLATALILMYFGSGPVRGFAITLTIGIIGSLFCALFVSRFFLEETWFKTKVTLKGS